MLKPVLAGALLCVTIAQARSSDLSGQQINDLVAGTTVEIETPVGTRLPVRYGRDGKLWGEARDLAWYLGSATDSGRWWVTYEQLCHKWNRWLESAPQCMRLSKEGRFIRWRTRDGYSGTAMISVPAAIEAAAVLPLVQPNGRKEIAAPETPPAPAGAPAEEPAEPATGAALPPRQVVQEPVLLAPPAARAVAAPDKGPPPPQAQQDQVEPKRPAPPTFRVANVRSDDVLNVRSGPSADFDIVGELPPGSRGIAVTSACRSSWCPVHLRGTSGWVNSAYLAPEQPLSLALPRSLSLEADSPEAPRACLTAAARALLVRIEQTFGPVEVISTCRPGATIAGTWRASRHASGNAVDFKAGTRKAAVVEWLIANHRSGGTMTYAGMDHIHVDIGPHFVSIAGGPHWQSWRSSGAAFLERRGRTSSAE